MMNDSIKKFTVTLENRRGWKKFFHLTQEEFAKFIRLANRASHEAWSNGYIENYREGMNDVWEFSNYNNHIKEDVTFSRIIWFLREPERIYQQALAK